MARSRPVGLSHGDAIPNNFMRLASGTVALGDWDHVAVGPREWDLAQIHYTHRRFRRPGAAALDEFAEAYGWDVRAWPGLNVMVATREITGLSAYIRAAASSSFARDKLAYRLCTLQRDDLAARWNPPATTEASGRENG